MRTREGAHWASWADSVATVSSKNADLAATIVDGLNSRADGCFAVANQSADRLVDFGVELPSWDAIVEGATPDHIHATPTDEPSVARGWQQHVSDKVEKAFYIEALWPSLDANERALALSQGGSLAGVPFHCFATSYATQIDSELFRTLLLRRLRLPLPFHTRACRCLLDSLGHHRCVRCVRGSGPERFCGGSGCGTHLPRGQGFDQRYGP